MLQRCKRAISKDRDLGYCDFSSIIQERTPLHINLPGLKDGNMITSTLSTVEICNGDF